MLRPRGWMEQAASWPYLNCPSRLGIVEPDRPPSFIVPDHLALVVDLGEVINIAVLGDIYGRRALGVPAVNLVVGAVGTIPDHYPLGVDLRK